MIRRTIFMTVLVAIVASAFAEEQAARAVSVGDQDDPIGRKLSARIGPYMETGLFSFVNDEKLKAWKKEYGRLTLDEKVYYCIFQLRNESRNESLGPFPSLAVSWG